MGKVEPIRMMLGGLESLYYLFKGIFGSLLESDGSIGKNAGKLLADPKTREEFIRFTHNDKSEIDSTIIDERHGLRKKTFQTADGESITIIARN